MVETFVHISERTLRVLNLAAIPCTKQDRDGFHPGCPEHQKRLMLQLDPSRDGARAKLEMICSECPMVKVSIPSSLG